ncbi:Zinc/iron permease [Spinellus fusiger]|nr:Zinc/iron permease [Spinellus fusiger]
MLNPFVWLLLLSITLLVGAFLFGSIPLAAKLSETKLGYLTALGVGLLISTALVVIIPEGVDTLYSSQSTVTKEDAEDTEASSPMHTAVGLSLVIGFATMFIVDQLSSMHIHGEPAKDTFLQSDTETDEPVEIPLEDSNTPLVSNSPSPSHYSAVTARAITPTIGLIVHAAADGIALGASASHPQLSMVVFFAIMLHKAPSAFALTTVLLAEGISRTQVRRHLLMFSMAAPLGAILTYSFLYLTSSTDATGIEYWTGILLIYSGGTFLYVAMHALQEVHHASTKMSHAHIGTILLGMFLPILMNIKHSH